MRETLRRWRAGSRAFEIGVFWLVPAVHVYAVLLLAGGLAWGDHLPSLIGGGIGGLIGGWFYAVRYGLHYRRRFPWEIPIFAVLAPILHFAADLELWGTATLAAGWLGYVAVDRATLPRGGEQA